MERNVQTAVEFLDGVYGRQHDEAALRKYLLQKQNLSLHEVNEAFNIHRARVGGRKSIKKCNDEQKTTERPEVTVGVRDKDLSYATCLLPNKRDAGKRLINDFINSEVKYCNLLGKLWSDYCVKLIDMALRHKLQMSPQKSKNLFKQIPHLLKFHNAFHKDLIRETDIGHLFFRSVWFFKGYMDYTKSIHSVIKQLGEYAGDEILQKSLSDISKNSKCSPSDLVGLLMVPLDRIQEYKMFLDNLKEMADKTKRSYKWLDKAARRIRRVALHVEKFRSVINNFYEMYRIQVYMSGQVNILVDERRIIRRGMMIRRTGGWTARNKQYVFFLFNDLLLWSSKKGVFQNFVPLHSCKVMPYQGINNSEKKFMVVSKTKDKVKMLFLECKTWRQRNDWCLAIKKAIKSFKKLGLEKLDEFSLVMDSEKVQVDLVSEEPNDNSEEPSVQRNKSKKSDDFVSESLTCTSEFKEDTREEQDTELVDYDFENSQNYAIRDCKEYETIEETSSQYSESDCEEQSVRRDRSTVDGMSPFRTHSRIRNLMPVHEKDKFSSNSSIMLRCGPSDGPGVSVVDRRSKGDIDIEELSRTDVDYSRSTSPGSCNLSRVRIIRRDKKDKRDVPGNSKAMVPRITISLGDFQGDGSPYKQD